MTPAAGPAAGAGPRAHPARDHCLAPNRTAERPLGGGHYTRMFPALPPLHSDDGLLRALGRAGGACDSTVCLRDEARTVAAGWPVFGQYVAHDLTADRSPVTHRNDSRELHNVRSARFDLENLYGAGPVSEPYMYRRDDPAKMLLTGDDLPRNVEGFALVGDPRQDVHTLISQMQVAFVRAHNRLVDRLRADGESEAGLFDAARTALTWHYQWVIGNDFLPMMTGAEPARRLLARPPAPDGAVAIPLEFADAAFRYGHSQVRHAFRIAAGGPELPLFPDLLGFRPVGPDRVVDWRLLFDVSGGVPAQRARPIDGRIPASLVHLPIDVTGELAHRDHQSLAVRDLLRGAATALPSGEAVAREIGAPPVHPDLIGLAGQGWAGETPLWYYVLKEAEAVQDGERLGPVGAHIVGEVLLRVLDGDPTSYRRVEPHWQPTLPGHVPGEFHLVDLLIPAR